MGVPCVQRDGAGGVSADPDCLWSPRQKEIKLVEVQCGVEDTFDVMHD